MADAGLPSAHSRTTHNITILTYVLWRERVYSQGRRLILGVLQQPWRCLGFEVLVNDESGVPLEAFIVFRVRCYLVMRCILLTRG